MTITAILVADKTHARFFLKPSFNRQLEEIEDWANSAGRLQDRDLVSSRPGRTFDRLGEGRHAMEPRTHAKQHLAEEFARYLVAELEQEAVNRKFEQLIVMAAPEFLGMMRQHFTPNLKHKLISEVDKNVIVEDTATIDTQVREILRPEQ